MSIKKILRESREDQGLDVFIENSRFAIVRATVR